MAADIEALIDREDPGIALLRAWAAQPDANASTFLARDPDLAGTTLLHLRVSTRSILGATVFDTGGISVAGGLLRLWGSGPERSLLEANRSAARAAGRDLPDILLVGDDMFGGLFAVNGGAFGSERRGEVFHLPADESRWSSLETGHSDFVAWCLTGDLDLLYGEGGPAAHPAHLARPPFGRVISTYPFPWTREGRAGDVAAREVAGDENLRLRIEVCGFEAE